MHITMAVLDAADASLIWARWDPFESRQENEPMRKVHEQLKSLGMYQYVNQVCEQVPLPVATPAVAHQLS
jgi:hypothetical protein